MDTNRRAFLIQSGSALGVLGLGYLLWEDAAPPPRIPGDSGRPPVARPPTGLLKAALERMRAESKPGIALRIPSDKANRHEPGHAIVHLLNQMDPGSIRLFAQAVIVCLESAVVEEQLAGAGPSHNLILFDGSRRAVAGLAFDYQHFWQGFAPELLGLVQGKDEGRLRSQAESIRRATPSPVIDALERLDSEGDRKVVALHAPRIAPLLVYEEMQPNQEYRKKALTEILRQYVESASPTAPGPRLPFGVEASADAGGCGDDCHERSDEQRRRVVACGMGRVGPNVRSFIRYLAS
jgi:hypothetical protein